MKKKKDEELEYSGKESEGKSGFGPERHGIREEDWPKKFVVDGGLKYDFGGPEAHGVEHDIADIDERAEDHGADIPGKTHKYDRSPGKIQSWPKKFEFGGEEDKDFEGAEEKDEEV